MGNKKWQSSNIYTYTGPRPLRSPRAHAFSCNVVVPPAGTPCNVVVPPAGIFITFFQETTSTVDFPTSLNENRRFWDLEDIAFRPFGAHILQTLPWSPRFLRSPRPWSPQFVILGACWRRKLPFRGSKVHRGGSLRPPLATSNRQPTPLELALGSFKMPLSHTFGIFSNFPSF